MLSLLSGRAVDTEELKAHCAEYVLKVMLSALLGPGHAHVPFALFQQLIVLMDELLYEAIVCIAFFCPLLTKAQNLATTFHARGRILQLSQVHAKSFVSTS